MHKKIHIGSQLNKKANNKTTHIFSNKLIYLFTMDFLTKNMKYLHLITILGLFLFFGNQAKAQWFNGGNIGFNFNNGGTTFDASPIIGYRIKKIEAGTAPFFTYHMPKHGDNQYQFGNRLFTKYHVGKGLFLHAEFETANYEISPEQGRKWTIGLPVGAGYEQRIKKIRIHASVLYDLLLETGSPKENPIYRGGIVYDF